MTIEVLIPETIADVNIECKNILSVGKNAKGDALEMDWLKTLAAFANGEGGRLFVGVENKEHKIVALDSATADKQVLLLHQEIRNRFDPVIYPEVKKHVVGEEEHSIILEIIVSHSPFLPVFVKDRGTYFTFVRRFGETNIASSQEVRQLVMASENVSYDSIYTDEEYNSDDFTSLRSLYRKNRGEELETNTLILKGFINKDMKLSKGALLFKDDTKDPLTAMSIV